MKSVNQIQAIHQQLLDGTLAITPELAAKFEDLDGARFDKKELAAYMAIENDRAAGKIQFTDRGVDAFFDLLKKKTQSRFSAFVEGFREGSSFGAKIASALGAVGLGAAALTGATVTVAAAPAIGAAALITLGAGAVDGAYKAIRN